MRLTRKSLAEIINKLLIENDLEDFYTIETDINRTFPTDDQLECGACRMVIYCRHKNGQSFLNIMSFQLIKDIENAMNCGKRKITLEHKIGREWLLNVN